MPHFGQVVYSLKILVSLLGWTSSVVLERVVTVTNGLSRVK